MERFVIFIFFLLNFNVFSQNIDETVILADKMFLDGEYISSIDLYKRAIFFSKENKRDLFKKCGDCYFMIENYKEAFCFYDSANFYNENLQVELDLIYKKADCLIFSENYKEAEKLVLSIEYIFFKKEVQKKNFYLGVISFVTADFKNSEQFFIKSIPDTAKNVKSDIYKIFKKINKLKRPNPKVAGILSLILPGSGQLYAGDYKNAINSFLLVAVFTAIGADMYLRYAWYDPLISVFPWFYRYYGGGYKNAKKIAYHKRTEKRNNKLNELIMLIKNNSISY